MLPSLCAVRSEALLRVSVSWVGKHSADQVKFKVVDASVQEAFFFECDFTPGFSTAGVVR